MINKILRPLYSIQFSKNAFNLRSDEKKIISQSSKNWRKRIKKTYNCLVAETKVLYYGKTALLVDYI